MHVTRAIVTQSITGRVCELWESRKEGRIGFWEGGDRVKGGRAGAF